MEHSTMKSILSVLIANSGAWLLTVATNVEPFLKVISLALAAGFTTWKWIHDYKQSKKKKR